MIESISPVSSTQRQIGPTLSKDQQSAMHPLLLTRPNVGLRPVVPHRSLGEVIEPKVSVPIAKLHKPAAVAEADPALEPLLPSFKFQGFFVRPPYQISLYASAPTAVFPSNTAPAARRRFTISASSKGNLF